MSRNNKVNVFSNSQEEEVDLDEAERVAKLESPHNRSQVELDPLDDDQIFDESIERLYNSQPSNDIKFQTEKGTLDRTEDNTNIMVPSPINALSAVSTGPNSAPEGIPDSHQRLADKLEHKAFKNCDKAFLAKRLVKDLEMENEKFGLKLQTTIMERKLKVTKDTGAKFPYTTDSIYLMSGENYLCTNLHQQEFALVQIERQSGPSTVWKMADTFYDEKVKHFGCKLQPISAPQCRLTYHQKSSTNITQNDENEDQNDGQTMYIEESEQGLRFFMEFDQGRKYLSRDLSMKAEGDHPYFKIQNCDDEFVTQFKDKSVENLPDLDKYFCMIPEWDQQRKNYYVAFDPNTEDIDSQDKSQMELDHYSYWRIAAVKDGKVQISLAYRPDCVLTCQEPLVEESTCYLTTDWDDEKSLFNLRHVEANQYEITPFTEPHLFLLLSKLATRLELGNSHVQTKQNFTIESVPDNQMVVDLLQKQAAKEKDEREDNIKNFTKEQLVDFFGKIKDHKDELCVQKRPYYEFDQKELITENYFDKFIEYKDPLVKAYAEEMEAEEKVPEEESKFNEKLVCNSLIKCLEDGGLQNFTKKAQFLNKFHKPELIRGNGTNSYKIVNLGENKLFAIQTRFDQITGNHQIAFYAIEGEKLRPLNSDGKHFYDVFERPDWSEQNKFEDTKTTFLSDNFVTYKLFAGIVTFLTFDTSNGVEIVLKSFDLSLGKFIDDDLLKQKISLEQGHQFRFCILNQVIGRNFQKIREDEFQRTNHLIATLSTKDYDDDTSELMVQVGVFREKDQEQDSLPSIKNSSDNVADFQAKKKEFSKFYFDEKKEVIKKKINFNNIIRLLSYQQECDDKWDILKFTQNIKQTELVQQLREQNSKFSILIYFDDKSLYDINAVRDGEDIKAEVLSVLVNAKFVSLEDEQELVEALEKGLETLGSNMVSTMLVSHDDLGRDHELLEIQMTRYQLEFLKYFQKDQIEKQDLQNDDPDYVTVPFDLNDQLQLQDTNNRAVDNVKAMGAAIHYDQIHNKLHIMMYYRRDLNAQRIAFWTVKMQNASMINTTRKHIMDYQNSISCYIADQLKGDNIDSMSRPLLTISRYCTSAVRATEKIIIDSQVMKDKSLSHSKKLVGRLFLSTQVLQGKAQKLLKDQVIIREGFFQIAARKRSTFQTFIKDGKLINISDVTAMMTKKEGADGIERDFMHPIDMIFADDDRDYWPFTVFNIRQENNGSRIRAFIKDVAFIMIDIRDLSYVPNTFVDLLLPEIEIAASVEEKWSTSHQMSMCFSSEIQLGHNSKGPYFLQQFQVAFYEPVIKCIHIFEITVKYFEEETFSIISSSKRVFTNLENIRVISLTPLMDVRKYHEEKDNDPLKGETDPGHYEQKIIGSQMIIRGQQGQATTKFFVNPDFSVEDQDNMYDRQFDYENKFTKTRISDYNNQFLTFQIVESWINPDLIRTADVPETQLFRGGNNVFMTRLLRNSIVLGLNCTQTNLFDFMKCSVFQNLCGINDPDGLDFILDDLTLFGTPRRLFSTAECLNGHAPIEVLRNEPLIRKSLQQIEEEDQSMDSYMEYIHHADDFNLSPLEKLIVRVEKDHQMELLQILVDREFLYGWNLLRFNIDMQSLLYLALKHESFNSFGNLIDFLQNSHQEVDQKRMQIMSCFGYLINTVHKEQGFIPALKQLIEFIADTQEFGIEDQKACLRIKLDLDPIQMPQATTSICIYYDHNKIDQRNVITEKTLEVIDKRIEQALIEDGCCSKMFDQKKEFKGWIHAVYFRNLNIGERIMGIYEAQSEDELQEAFTYSFNEKELNELLDGLLEMALMENLQDDKLDTIKDLIDFQYHQFGESVTSYKFYMFTLFIVIPLITQMAVYDKQAITVLNVISAIFQFVFLIFEIMGQREGGESCNVQNLFDFISIGYSFFYCTLRILQPTHGFIDQSNALVDLALIEKNPNTHFIREFTPFLHCIELILILYQWTFYLQIYKSLNETIRLLVVSISDVLTFTVIVFLLIVAYHLVFLLLGAGFQGDVDPFSAAYDSDFPYVQMDAGNFVSLITMTIGNLYIPKYDYWITRYKKGDVVFAQFYIVVIWIVWISMFVILCIVMMNFLIAILSDSYAHIKESELVTELQGFQEINNDVMREFGGLFETNSKPIDIIVCATTISQDEDTTEDNIEKINERLASMETSQTQMSQKFDKIEELLLKLVDKKEQEE